MKEKSNRATTTLQARKWQQRKEKKKREKKIKPEKRQRKEESPMAGKTNEDAERMARELSQKKSECVRVIVRVRPISKKEIDGAESAGCRLSTGESRTVVIRDPKADKRDQPKSHV